MKKIENPKWYEPYSRFRRFCWYWCFIAALVCIPGTFLAEKHATRLDYGVHVVVNLFLCWVAFNSTFNIKKDGED